MERMVTAWKNRCMPVVFSDHLLEFRVVFSLAFREENQVGPAKGIRRLAQNSPREDMAIAKGILSIDKEKVEAVAEAEVLVAIVQKKGVGPVVADGVACAFDAVGIHEDGYAWEVAGEHEGFIPGLGGIEENGFPVGNNAGR